MFPAGRTICRSGLSPAAAAAAAQTEGVPSAIGDLRTLAWVAAPTSSPPQRGHSHSSHTSTGKSTQRVLVQERKQAWGHEVRLRCTTGQFPFLTRGKREGVQAAAHRQLASAQTPREPENSGDKPIYETSVTQSSKSGAGIPSHLLPPRLTFEAGAQQLGRSRSLSAAERAARKPPRVTEGSACR